MPSPRNLPIPAPQPALRALFLAVDPVEQRGRAYQKGIWIVPISADEQRAEIGAPRPVGGPDGLVEEILNPELSPGRAGTYLWTLRGWQDWVLSGLTEAIDGGQITYKFIRLDGSAANLAGAIRGRPLKVASLPAWTGSDWRKWADCTRPMEAIRTPELAVWDALPVDLSTAARAIAGIMHGVCALSAGRLALTPGGQARQIWSRWLGPQLPTVSQPATRSGAPSAYRYRPIPLRRCPAPASRAARIACYGLAYHQYQYGHASDSTYVYDLSGAYLTALCRAPLSAVYSFALTRPSPATLTAALEAHVALALVRLRPSGRAWPTRHNGRTEWATGDLWTWLCGEELRVALESGSVLACEQAFLWHRVDRGKGDADCLCRLADQLRAGGHDCTRLLWRSLYSALVGGWGAWQRIWRDTGRASPLGRWGTWTEQDRETGLDRRWRSVAGRVQVREDVGDAPSARPIAFACVTAAVRAAVEKCRALLPPGSVLYTYADAIWLTERGHECMQKSAYVKALRPWAWKHKETFDEVWMDGAGRAVCQKGGVQVMHVPGIPQGARIGPDGRGRWKIVEPWNTVGPKVSSQGVGVGEARWNAARHCRENSGPLREAQPWLELDGGLLREELLCDE